MLDAFIEDLVTKQAVLCELESMLAKDSILVINTWSFDLKKMVSMLNYRHFTRLYYLFPNYLNFFTEPDKILLDLFRQTNYLWICIKFINSKPFVELINMSNSILLFCLSRCTHLLLDELQKSNIHPVPKSANWK